MSLIGRRFHGSTLLPITAAVLCLAGCGGGSKTTTFSTPPTNPPPPTTNSAVVAKNIYVPDGADSTLDVYAANLNGTASPSSSIPVNAVAVTGDSSGNLYLGVNTSTLGTVQVFSSLTSLAHTITLPDGGSLANNQVQTLAVDSMGYLYVGMPTAIYVYAPGVSGTTAPVRTISGALTTLSSTLSDTQMALDTAGDLYVAEGGGYAGAQVVKFAPGANGNAAPAIVTASSYNPTGVALDSTGNIYICQGTLDGSSTSPNNGTAAIYEFAAGSLTGATPMRTISGSNLPLGIYTSDIQIDSAGNIFVMFVADGQADFAVFSATANGNVAPASILVRGKGSTTDSQFYLM